MLGIITPKVQENITAVGKVKLHVWTWGQRPAAAAEALNKWDGCDARTEGKWAYPLPSFGVRGYYPREICEDIGSNLWNLVHFGV